MWRIYMDITEGQRKELRQHLTNNGYCCYWEDDDCIQVDYDELYEVRTILDDRGIRHNVEEYF